MKRLLPLLSLGILLPLVASAVSIAPAEFYSDVRSSSREAAAINLLTREGIVEGIGDGYFGPARQVNRAEFLKIAILSTPEGSRPSTVSRDCFPDVRASDWFSGTVCGAKDLGIVRGNADPTKPESEWLFTPDAQVTYDAALKMMTLLFGYEVRSAGSGEDWGQPYFEAARKRGVDLPIPIRFDSPLTRGMAARLTAAFLAESQGQLEELRMAEAGVYQSSSESSSSSSVSSSTSSSIESSTSPSSSSSSSAALFRVPAVSHFLLVGQKSDAIAQATLSPLTEESEIIRVQVKLAQEARSLEALELVLLDGTVVASMPRKPYSNDTDYQLMYETPSAGPVLHTRAANTSLPLVVRAVVRAENNDGFSDNLVQVRSISFTMRGKQTNTTYNIPFGGPFPKNKTSFGRIGSLTSTSPLSAPLTSGSDTTVTSFSITTERLQSKSIYPMQFVFTYEQTGGQTIFLNWRLKRTDTNIEAPCTVNVQDKTISCANLQTVFGEFPTNPMSVSLIAGTSVPTSADNETFQVSLLPPGSPEQLGSIWWTDGTGTFRWVEGDAPLLTGTMLSK